MLRKNKDLKTIKEGVVGKYVKKDTPPEMPSKQTHRFLDVFAPCKTFQSILHPIQSCLF